MLLFKQSDSVLKPGSAAAQIADIRQNPKVARTTADSVRIPATLLLRDAMYRMNEVFAVNATLVDHQGQVIGWLTQQKLVDLFAEDADLALRTPCFALLVDRGDIAAA